MTTKDHAAAPERAAFGIGLATISDADGRVLDVRFPRLGVGWDPAVQSRLGIEGAGLVDVPSDKSHELVGAVITHLIGADLRRGVQVRFIALHIADLDAASGRHLRRLPSAAPAVGATRAAPNDQPRRHLRRC